MATQSPLRFYLLGPFRVENDQGVVKLATKPTGALLAYLVLHHDAWHERARLATLFWGSETANEFRRRPTDESIDKLARTSFRKALSQLRKQLGADLILDSDDGKKVRLNPDVPVWVDAHEFINPQSPVSSPQSLISNLQLYRGDLLQGYSDDPDAPWLDALRDQCRERFVQMCLTLAQQARERGEWANVIEYAQTALARDAINETAAQHLIVAYSRQGDTERALRVYSELERALFQETGSAPSNSTRALRRHIERNTIRAKAAELSNLPTFLTPFLGRESEVEKLRALLQSARLVTLVGTGGSGKTRLGVQVARETIQNYRDGVWWVRLEELDRETGSVAQSIAHVLSVRGDAGRPLLETLCDQLRDSEMLVVLDNCEHLIADCARVAEQLLNACPHIRILATSRQRLHVAGEVDFPVPALPLPNEQAQFSALEASEAVRFFLHYARAARANFTLRATNAASIAQICRRLDGIPLALELAAARVKTLSAEYIAEHLGERFELFAAQHHTVARHQTLRAVLDWSYDLLSAEEQRVFAALSVFAARFTPEAAEAVCGGEYSSTRDILEELADKSLVLVEFDANDAVRYRLLETIREYAREKLAASPEQLTAANERLSKYYMQFSQQHAKNYLAIEDEWNNISTGMSIAHERQDWKPLLDYGQAVTDALFARGLYTDARRIIPWVITAADREEEQERSIQAMYNWGNTYIIQSLYDDAQAIMRRLLELGRAARDFRGTGLALYGLGRLDVEHAKYDTARVYLQQALEMRAQIQDNDGIAEVLIQLGLIDYLQANYDAAKHSVQQAVRLLAPPPPTLLLIEGLQTLALIARAEQDLPLAEFYCRDAMIYCEELQNKSEQAEMAFILAQILEERTKYREALALYLSSRAIYEQIGEPKPAAMVADALCGLLAEMGEPEQAEEYGRLAIETYQKLNYEKGLVAAKRRLGIALVKQNRTVEACELWKDALARARKLNDIRIPYLEALLEKYCG